MIIKLIIIGIVILSGTIFVISYPMNGTQENNVVNLLEKDLKNIQNNMINKIDQQIEKTADKTKDRINDLNEPLQKINFISSNESVDLNKEASESDELNKEASESDELNKEASESDYPKNTDIPNIVIYEDKESSKQQIDKTIFETLSFSTTQNKNDIHIQYKDSSVNTQSVTITIRNSEKEIFSGTFVSSMFETAVNDISGTPYYVDLNIEHNDYGTVSSSVFNPGDSDTVINGVFSKN